MALRKTDLELLRYIAGDDGGALADELRRWFEARPRFVTFAAADRDKIRKKVRTATDEDGAVSVRAELLTAFLLLADPRFDVTPEAFGVGNRGPDLTLTFRGGYRFNVEVTQLRRHVPAELGARLPTVVHGKLRQLRSGMANVIVAAVPASPVSERDLAAAMRLLKIRAERADDAFATRHGFPSARSLRTHYQRLSAVCVVDPDNGGAASWANPDARHALPAEPARAMRHCLETAAVPERRSAASS